MLGNVDTDLAHGFDGERADTDRFGSGAVNFEGVTAEMPEEALSHLAAGRVAGAEDEDAVSW